MVIKHDFVYTPNGENRRLHIWLPAGYEASRDRYPVMYFFDGHNLFFNEDATYGKSWGLKEFLESWEKDMIIVGIECSHTGNRRLHEYLPYPASDEFFGPLEVLGNQTLDWIVEEVKPWVDENYRTWPFRECTGIAGSSMGGLMGIRAAVGYNRWFSKAACISSAIGFCPEPLFADIAATPMDPDTRVYLSWGSREAWQTADPMHADPQSKSYIWNHAAAEAMERWGATTLVQCQEGGGHCEADWEKLVPEFMDFLWMR